MSGRYKAVPTGTIANGKPVLVNSTGTVSQVSATGSAAAFGSEVTYESASCTYNAVTFDSSNNKIVVAYNDGGSNEGFAAVGTIDSSDNSISFGTPVRFNPGAASYIDITFDSNSNRVVIAFAAGNNSSHGSAVVGTVSGTAISFGSVVVFESAGINSTACAFDSTNNKIAILYKDTGAGFAGTSAVGTVSGTSISFGSARTQFDTDNSSHISATFDSSNGKVVIAYQDVGDSSKGKVIVGTISGTGMYFFGSATEFESGTTIKNSIVFDSNSNKVVISYCDAGDSNKGKAIVGTVNSSAISFGTAVEFNAGETDDYISSTFDSNSNTVITVYNDRSNSDYGTVNIGTVSGTSISYGGETVFNTGTTNHIGSSFDSNVNSAVIAYQDAGNSSYGTAIVYKGASTNLTSEGYIGLSNACSFHGATETYTVTVASGALYGGGTGNVFYLNGLSNPPIQLLKGHTYIFDQADSSNSGHPFHFKDTGGSQYTSGVTVTGTAGQAGAKVTIVVPIDATEPSQYYCTAHGNGMGNLVTIEESFAEVDIVGTVNKHQSGLTAGQTYFVQTDGTLGTSADSPSVVAGTAISATEIIVKG